MEFPRVDPRRHTVPHRYGYGVVAPPEGYTGGAARLHLTEQGAPAGPHRVGAGLAKYDLERGTSEIRWNAPGEDSGEAVFVPASADAAEDDGWLLSYVFDPARGASDLVILAARDITGDPVARVHLPVRVPLGFHGNWVPDGG